MKAEEILILQDRIKSVGDKLRESLKSGNADKALASLKTHTGWQLIEHSFEKMIAELLEPIPYENVSPEAYTVRGEAHRLTILMLRTVLEQVESAVTALRDVEQSESEQKTEA